MKLERLEFNEVELFWKGLLCRSHTDVKWETVVIFFTIDLANWRIYENRQYHTIIAINNLGFSTECAGRGCNSAVCAVDIQLCGFFKPSVRSQTSSSVVVTGNDYGCISQVQFFSCCLKLHIKVSSVLWTNGCNKKKLHYHRKEVQGNGPYIIYQQAWRYILCDFPGF